MFGVKCGSGFVFPQTAFQLSQCWSLTRPSLPQSRVPEEFIPHLSSLTADFPAAPSSCCSPAGQAWWCPRGRACLLIREQVHVTSCACDLVWCQPAGRCWNHRHAGACLIQALVVLGVLPFSLAASPVSALSPCSCFSLPSFHLVPPARSRPCWQRTDSLLTE